MKIFEVYINVTQKDCQENQDGTAQMDDTGKYLCTYTPRPDLGHKLSITEAAIARYATEADSIDNAIVQLLELEYDHRLINNIKDEQ